MYRLGVPCIPYTIRSPTSQISLFDLYQEADLGRPPGAQCKRCSRKGTLVMAEKPLLETIPVFRCGRKGRKTPKRNHSHKIGGFSRLATQKLWGQNRPKQNFVQRCEKIISGCVLKRPPDRRSPNSVGEKTSPILSIFEEWGPHQPNPSTKVFHETPNEDFFGLMMFGKMIFCRNKTHCQNKILRISIDVFFIGEVAVV